MSSPRSIELDVAAAIERCEQDGLIEQTRVGCSTTIRTATTPSGSSFHEDLLLLAGNERKE